MAASSVRRTETSATAPELPAEVAKQYGLHHEVPSSEKKPKTPAADQLETSLDDPEIDQAVDDIMAKESDALLENGEDTQPGWRAVKTNAWIRIGHFFRAWWRNRWARFITITVLVSAIAIPIIFPSTRYAALNVVGVRSSASVQVLDDTTELPLKNVTVQIGADKVLTNREGIAQLKNLRLGDNELQISRVAFAPHKQKITLGWGSNPLGKYLLRAVGVQYELHISDFLSKAVISGAEAESQAANALSGKDGKIILTTPDPTNTTLDVVVSAPGYRKETIKLAASSNKTVTQLSLVPEYRHAFVSKQAGKQDVYAIDLDGRNQKLILAGTGKENDATTLVSKYDGTQAALVSTRGDTQNADGFLLQSLSLINTAQGTASVLDRSEQIRPVDWLGNRLIYRSTIAGLSAANSSRNRLLSYDLSSNSKLQLANANQFNAVLSDRGHVYYSVSATDPQVAVGVFRVSPDGKNREIIFTGEAWTVIQTTYDQLSFQSPDGWLDYKVSTNQTVKSASPPSAQGFFFAADSQYKRLVWIERRDGKETILLKDLSSGEEKKLAVTNGATTPLKWAGDKAIIYRVVTKGEIADYVVSPNGGEPRKISDVTATRGYLRGIE